MLGTSLRTLRAVLLAGMAALLLLAAAWDARGSSLWDDGGVRFFADRRVRRVGDLITLIITEQAQAQQTAETRTGKAAEVTLGPLSGLFPGAPRAIGAAGSDEMEAGGTTSRGGSLQARMTVAVIALDSVGNLVLEGHQRITVNGEEQELIVRGVVRPEDVRPDNTVLSTYLGNAEIHYVGQGTLGDRQEAGVLSRFFHWLF